MLTVYLSAEKEKDIKILNNTSSLHVKTKQLVYTSNKVIFQIGPT